jgi:hypothetical protein
VPWDWPPGWTGRLAGLAAWLDWPPGWTGRLAGLAAWLDWPPGWTGRLAGLASQPLAGEILPPERCGPVGSPPELASLEQMELLHWEHRPSLRQPAFVAAFEGWNDAGNAASGAVAYLSKSWGATRFAAFDAEELFDFTSARPQVSIESGEARRIDWPSILLSSAAIPGTDRDVVLMSGPEPQLRWRSLAAEVCAACRTLEVTSAVLLGAMLADVPHTRPVRVSGGAATSELAVAVGLEPSYYEGPTGIVGIISDTLVKEGISTTSLWASVPHYVSQSSSPKATLALVERAARVLRAQLDTTDLQIASAAYERQVNELVASDEDASAYVSKLEEQDAEERQTQGQVAQQPLRPASGERLAAEVERFLREHHPD